MNISLSKLTNKLSFKYFILQGMVFLTTIVSGILSFLFFMSFLNTTVGDISICFFTAWIFMFPYSMIYAFIGFLISLIIKKDKWLFSLPVIFITFVICIFIFSTYTLMGIKSDVSPLFWLGVIFSYSIKSFSFNFPTLVLFPYLILLIFDFILKPSSDSPPLSGRDRLRVYIQLFGAGLFILTCLVYIASIFFILWYT